MKKLLWDAVHFSLSGSNVRIHMDLDPNLWDAELDGTQFEQVVHNLVINADQAMEQGGALRVSARNVSAQAPLGSSTTSSQATTGLMP